MLTHGASGWSAHVAARRGSVAAVKTPHSLLFASLAAISTSCAHASQEPPAAAPTAGAPPAELWCGPVSCPAWLAPEPATTGLPLRERCNLLSKVLMYQPLALVGRPLSAFENSQSTGVGRLDERLAALVDVQQDAQTRGQSWFGAGETCGAGILVLAPSTTRAELTEGRSFFHLALTPLTPGSVRAFDFELRVESLDTQAVDPEFEPLRGRVERATSAGPDGWDVVVHASVNSADALKD